MKHAPALPDDDAFDALGSPVRREIVRLVGARPRAVGELAAALPVSRPAVSKHLRVLERAALVRIETSGTRHVVHLEPRGFDAARAWLDAFWDEALARFALVAENLAPRTPAATDAPPGRAQPRPRTRAPKRTR